MAINKNAGYDNKGGYNGYAKNNNERAENDFYATPPEEVINILRYEPLEMGQTVLEPCCGMGHMIQGIDAHIEETGLIGKVKVVGTDLIDRGNTDPRIVQGLDFFSDAYPFSNKADVIIMNPPYDIIEDFTLKALERTDKVIMLARTQFAESQSRYENIFKDNPPTKIYQYVDRIACYKNGDFTKKQSSAQAYAWFVFDNNDNNKETKYHWIRRFGK